MITLPAYADTLALADEERNELVITIRIVDGQAVIVSRYGDAAWNLHGQPTNTQASERTVRFTTVPDCFRDTMKAITYRYMHRGQKGDRRPSDRSISKLVRDAIPFLRYVVGLNVSRMSEVTAEICFSYAEACRRHRTRGKPLKPSALCHRLAAVEALYWLSQHTQDVMPGHPWPQDSATRLAGATGRGTGDRGGHTPLMPDEVFSTLFRKSWELLERGSEILEVRDAWLAHKLERGEAWDMYDRSRHLGQFVKGRGWRGALHFNQAVRDLRTACYIIVASLSGCRNHEVAFIVSGACYSTTSPVDDQDDAEIYWWMRSQSTKTGVGQTEWMVPEAVKRALDVMEIWARPLQLQIDTEIMARRALNPLDPEIAEAQRHRDAIFLQTAPRRQNEARTWTLSAVNIALKTFARDCGVNWLLASHHFRRKFANYAARSQFGDLRYLKQHFKHWSVDMTLGYALNESQEVALYAEIQDELDDLKVEVVETWLQRDAKLSGGYGTSIVAWRGSNPVTLFKGHGHMVQSLAESTPIRSNGHSFCTADDDLCVGNDMEKTRCSICKNAVIDPSHAHIYRGLHKHLAEVVVRCEDIGRGGRELAKRDIERCRKVLEDLGEDVEA